MAIATVVIERWQLAFLVCFFRQLHSLRRMLMTMMTEMRSMELLMLAIRSCCRPGILEWQSEQQKDEKEFFHGINHSTAGHARRAL